MEISRSAFVTSYAEHFFQIGFCEIPQVSTIHAAVFRNQAHNHQIITGGFDYLYTLILYNIGKAGHGGLKFVLYL
jgi:hypothetical protein